MNLTSLLLNIGIVAVILSVVIVFALKKQKNILTTFLQAFCGVLFLFSGWVKAVDPLGTAYKMEQYFTEFESTFSDTALSFLAPLFPFLSNFSVMFSVGMIIFEIVLGLLLILGYLPKFTAWAFFILVAFFTFLTGFTYLTGYVPEGVNFFSMGDWGPYLASNMKVTDCGCFGDFIKLEPKTSFLKDVFLLIPAIYFIVRNKTMHNLISRPALSAGVTGLSIVGLLIYCMSNYVWDLPHIDFRPFSIGKDVAATKLAEEEAMASVKITDWKLQNRTDKKTVTLSNADYMSNFKDYPKTEWEVLEQIKTEAPIKATKISEFEISDVEGNDITYKLLEEKGAKILVVSPKLYADVTVETQTILDTLYTLDTVLIDGNPEMQILKTLDTIVNKEISVSIFNWKPKFAESINTQLMPVLNGLTAKGIEVIYVAGGAGVTEMEALGKDFNMEGIELATADDILLKTIVRSNPGVVLWKDGVIINKWHIDKLPSAEQILKTHF